MTKKKGAVWKHWTVNQTENNNNNKSHPSVQCNYCPKVFDRAVSLRMQNHLDKECLGAPDNAKSKQNVNSQIENFADCISKEEQKDLEFLLAQALFSAGIPFVFVNNPLVIQFFKYFWLFFKLPNRKKLADDLLDDIYEMVKLQTDEQISKAKILCMVSDGWSNINHESVQNFIVCTPKPIFFNATFSGEESHMGKWVANEIIQQMEAIGVHKFSAVITDIASVMKSAWRRIEEKYFNVVCLGCNSHIINLLIGDVLKINEVKTIVDNAKMIVNYFKSHMQVAAKLKPLEQTLMDSDIRKKMDSAVRNFVLSEDFWEMLDTITKFLEPMVMALKLFELDTSTFSTVYFKKLMNQYSYHPVMMAAYMLNPCFLEESRNTDIEAIGYNEFTVFTNKRFGQEEFVNMFAELVKFCQKNSPYNNETIWLLSTNLSPSVWWQSWPKSSLQELAIKILSIPTSSTAAERNFSTFRFIHNKIHLDNNNNKNKDNDVNNDEDNDDRMFGLKLNITNLTTE
ncbi:unnamed protein product [Rhizophagus irregularis]|nr:unnamed protein product [Rhizophagus irregularis]